MKHFEDDTELFAAMRSRLFTAVVGDILDTMGLQHQFLPPQIKALRDEPLPLFAGIEYSEDSRVINQWAPLLMQRRRKGEPFTATRVPTGIALRGRITDEAMRQAVESLARARFGTVESSLLVDPQTPPGWTVRVMAAIEAMADLDDGTVKVTPDLVRLTGASGSSLGTEAQTAVPALTTVSVDPQGMGQRAAELLLKQIKAGKAEPETIVGSVRLVVRQSCGAAVERKREALA